MREQIEAVQRMQDYIESHLRERMTLEDLANAAGYVPEHACRIFSRHVGLSPIEYARARRLSRAALELRDARKRVLPEKLRTPETSEYVQGVEVPLDYAGPIPNGMEIIELEPCHMMVFQGPSFPDEEFGERGYIEARPVKELKR